MNLWLVITLVMACVVYVIDYLLRKKKWKDNTKEEKTSLIVNMFSVGPYAFLSALGMLLGITSGGAESAFGEIVHDVTLMMGGVYFIVAFVAIIMSLVLRKKGKIKASIWIHVIAVLYIVVVLAVNSLAGAIL